MKKLSSLHKELYHDGIGHVEYVEHMGDDLKVVNSARVSFDQHTERLRNRDRELIKYLTTNGHTSTLEHNIVTFRFKVPLFVRSQHHRHRVWSFNERSFRYTSENIEFYEPPSFRTQSKSDRQASMPHLANPLVTLPGHPEHSAYASDLVQEQHRVSTLLYQSLLDAGVCREQARGVLPQNLYTEYYGTCDLNNLFKYILLRDSEHAQWEHQRVAIAVLEFLRELYPIATKGFEEARKENAQ